MSPVFQASDLFVSLGGTPVLRGVSFDVEPGTWVGVIGPNGSGKTTLLRTLGGLLPHAGDLALLGRPLTDWPGRERAQRLAFLRQTVGLSFDFTVAEFALLGRLPHKGWLEPYRRRDRELLTEALAHVDLSGFQDRLMSALSGGEQRRVLLAQALVQQADILLLDEPTTHLDVHHKYEVLDHVRNQVDDGRTVIGVFHDLELAARYADTLLVIQDGQIRATGAPSDVLTRELIADVFRMDAESETTPAGELRVRYLAPIARAARNGDSVRA